MLRIALFAVLLVLAPVARSAAACEVALVLAMDVSGSVDPAEYRLQTEGLALALADPDIADTLLRGQVALMVVQWSGVGLQAVSIPWQRMLSHEAVVRFADRVTAMPRAFDASDTAVGEGLAFAAAQFDAVPDCRRRIIDMSGDGAENAGHTVARARRAAVAAGVEVNALAIESLGLSITQFYRNWVISPRGFVVTAQGHLDYARAIRVKLLRELSRPIG
jgi:Ca-activated chloride channel family protein